MEQLIDTMKDAEDFSGALDILREVCRRELNLAGPWPDLVSHWTDRLREIDRVKEIWQAAEQENTADEIYSNFAYAVSMEGFDELYYLAAATGDFGLLAF